MGNQEIDFENHWFTKRLDQMSRRRRRFRLVSSFLAVAALSLGVYAVLATSGEQSRRDQAVKTESLEGVSAPLVANRMQEQLDIAKKSFSDLIRASLYGNGEQGQYGQFYLCQILKCGLEDLSEASRLKRYVVEDVYLALEGNRLKVHPAPESPETLFRAVLDEEDWAIDELRKSFCSAAYAIFTASRRKDKVVRSGAIFSVEDLKGFCQRFLRKGGGE